VGNVYAGIQYNLTVASFQDSNSSLQASQFTATIQWGDGTQSSGTVVGGNGTFSVQGTHTYAVDSIDQPGGAYQVTVTISDPSGNTLTSNGTVMVTRPQMTGLGADIAGQPGTTLNNVQVAEFTVPDATDGQGEFSATINWGDGNNSSGTIQEVSPGMFAVLGSHAYASAGLYAIQASLSQDWINPLLIPLLLSSAAIGESSPSAALNAPKTPDTNTYWVVGNSSLSIHAVYTGKTKSDPPPTVTIDPVNSDAVFLGWTRSKYSPPSVWDGKIFFGNTTASLTVTVTFAEDKEKPATFDVNVIQVNVGNPPRGQAFTPGTPTDVLQQIKPGAGPNKGTPYKLVSSAPQGQAGFAWKANVGWRAPQSLTGTGINLEIGFVQHVNFVQLEGFYPQPIGKTLIARSTLPGRGNILDMMEGTALKNQDYNKNLFWTLPVPVNVSRYPFYSGITGQDVTLPPNVEKKQLLVYSSGQSDSQSRVIGASDSPAVMVPWFDNTNMKNPLKYIQFKWVFTLDVVADLTTGNGATSFENNKGAYYWPEATVTWVYAGDLKLDPTKPNLPVVKGLAGTRPQALTKGWQYPSPPYVPLDLASVVRPLYPELFLADPWGYPRIPFAIPETLLPVSLPYKNWPVNVANQAYAEGPFTFYQQK
jgi:hypothetical protein